MEARMFCQDSGFARIVKDMPFASGKARVAIVRLCARYVLYVVGYCKAGVAVAQMWRIMAQYISLRGWRSSCAGV